MLSRGIEQGQQIAKGEIGGEANFGPAAITRDGLVHEEAAERGGQAAERVELAEQVEDLAGEEADERVEEGGGDGGGGVTARVVLLGADEGGEVGARLRDDEVVDVEEFADAFEGGFLEFGDAAAAGGGGG